MLLFLWILGFFIGALLQTSTIGDGYTAFIIPAALLSVMILASLSGRVLDISSALLILLCGLYWGYSHHRGLMSQSGESSLVMQISRGNGDGKTGRYLGLSDAFHDKEILIAKGKASSGSIGSVFCKAKHDGFCYWRTLVQMRIIQRNLIWRLSSQLHHFLKIKVMTASNTLSVWMASLLFSQSYRLDYRLVKAMKDSGIYHLIVISGFHVGLIFGVAKMILRAPFFLLYVTSVMQARFWLVTYQISALAVIPLGFICLLSIGLTPSSTRAFLLFSTYEIARICLGKLSSLRLIAITGVVQTIFFPQGLIDSASLLSWGSFLILRFGPNISNSKYHLVVNRLATLCMKQIFITLLNITVFGTFSFISVLANLIFVPMFPFIFFLSGFALLSAFPPMEHFVCIILEYYWLAMHRVSDYANVIEVSPRTKILMGLLLFIGPTFNFARNAQRH